MEYSNNNTLRRLLLYLPVIYRPVKAHTRGYILLDSTFLFGLCYQIFTAREILLPCFRSRDFKRIYSPIFSTSGNYNGLTVSVNAATTFLNFKTTTAPERLRAVFRHCQPSYSRGLVSFTIYSILYIGVNVKAYYTQRCNSKLYVICAIYTIKRRKYGY